MKQLWMKQENTLILLIRMSISDLTIAKFEINMRLKIKTTNNQLRSLQKYIQSEPSYKIIK